MVKKNKKRKQNQNRPKIPPNRETIVKQTANTEATPPQPLEITDTDRKFHMEDGLMFGNNNIQKVEVAQADQKEEEEKKEKRKALLSDLKSAATAAAAAVVKSKSELDQALEKQEDGEILTDPSLSETVQQPFQESQEQDQSEPQPEKMELPSSGDIDQTEDTQPLSEKADTALQVEGTTEEVVIELQQEDSAAATIRKRYIKAGAVMMFFAVIGLIATIWLFVNVITSFVNKTSFKEEMQAQVYPLVVVDVPEFDSADRLDQKVIISAGIWQFLMQADHLEKYEKDEYGTMTVPAVDIEPYIRQIFGSDVPIQHQMIPDTEFYIPYDEENNLYYIPETPQVLPYAPKILSITNAADGVYQVEVGYILPGPFWNVQKNVEEEPGKIMMYTMQKQSGNNYVVTSVKQVLKEGQKPLTSENDGETVSGGYDEDYDTSQIVSDVYDPVQTESFPVESLPEESTPEEVIPESLPVEVVPETTEPAVDVPAEPAA